MSAWCTAADVAELTALDESAMNEQFEIAYQTRVSDGAGSYTIVTTIANTAGYLWTLDGNEAGGDQVKATGRHRIAIPKATNVPPTAKITQLATGKVFLVKYPFPVTSYATSLIIGMEDA